jgi:hypothetical protein
MRTAIPVQQSDGHVRPPTSDLSAAREYRTHYSEFIADLELDAPVRLMPTTDQAPLRGLRRRDGARPSPTRLAISERCRE